MQSAKNDRTDSFIADPRARWEQRYTEGFLPWDSGITPPEVETFWASDHIPRDERPEAVALDMGCGTGTNLAFLAGLGLRAVGVELAHNALAIAQQRLHQNYAALLPRIHLIQASVVHLPLINLGARYILDIGCFHTIHPESRADYAAGVIANLAPGGYYHLYGFDWMEARAKDPNKSPRGLRPTEVQDLFAAGLDKTGLDVIDIERARPNPHPCRWYLLQKRV